MATRVTRAKKREKVNGHHLEPKVRSVEADDKAKPCQISRLPAEVLQHIFEFLPVAEIRSCRLVHPFWKDAAFKPTRKKCRQIMLISRDKSIWKRTMELIFCICDSRQNFPCDAFELQLDTLTLYGNISTLQTVQSFLRLSREWLRELCLTIDFNDAVLISTVKETAKKKKEERNIDIVSYYDEYQGLAPPRLKQLPLNDEKLGGLKLFKLSIAAGNVDTGAMMIFNNYADVFAFCGKILKHAANVEEVILDVDMSIRDPTTLPLFCETLSVGNNVGMGLGHLIVRSAFSDIDWAKLIALNLKLKSFQWHTKQTLLKPPFDKDVFKNFLESVKTTLTTLEIRHELEPLRRWRGLVNDLIPISVCFPKGMVALKMLKISSRFYGNLATLEFPDVQYSEMFPNLEELCVRDLVPVLVQNNFFGYGLQPLDSLERLAVPQILNSWSFPFKLSRIFPNLKSLHVWANQDMMLGIIQHLQNLEVLSIVTSLKTVDSLFIHGLDTDYVCPSTESGRQTIMESKNFTALKKLKTLKIRYSRNDIQRSLGFTDMTVHVLVNMESLRCLDLGQLGTCILDKEEIRLMTIMQSKFVVRYQL